MTNLMKSCVGLIGLLLISWAFGADEQPRASDGSPAIDPPAASASAVSASPPDSIHVVSATYGASCRVSAGNQTTQVASACDGKSICRFVADNRFGDPAFGCSKDFLVQWRCGDDAAMKTVRHSPVVGEGYEIALSCGDEIRAGEMPTQEQVQAWWKQNSSEELTIEGALLEVHLQSKEVAYIAPVGFYDRGRNFIWHAVLVRPALQQVREIPSPVGNQNISVLDLDDDGVSEVVSESVASGGGTTERNRSIVRFDGFTPIVMHEIEEEDNLGDCRNECETVSTLWKFGRQSFTGLTSLTETVTTSRGPREGRMKARSEIRRYVLLGNVFVRADSRDLRYRDEVRQRSTSRSNQSE